MDPSRRFAVHEYIGAATREWFRTPRSSFNALRVVRDAERTREVPREIFKTREEEQALSSSAAREPPGKTDTKKDETHMLFVFDEDDAMRQRQRHGLATRSRTYVGPPFFSPSHASKGAHVSVLFIRLLVRTSHSQVYTGMDE
ncbi:hypothetical protein DM02DRAFT_400745 [Periconia macrospinosa]|uniref:Uncharacterized protein n=1 Tax=Periconia macrospinosa TaxID=97972 RepID=A0A2V1DPU4_9PLEO|nr:hypothetical protein DM02DRAFT_400745 [Periconia macrospinosa]